MTTWLKDDRGNRCSVEYFGSNESAQKALDSLKDCDNCINCSDCSDCSGCSRCSRCSYCSRCSDCSDCSRCSGCSRCSRCSYLGDPMIFHDCDGSTPALALALVAAALRALADTGIAA